VSRRFEETHLGSGSGAYRGTSLLLTVNRKHRKLLWNIHRRETRLKETRSDILQGTLDLMVLKTLEGLGPLHGYGIARRIEQVSEGVLSLNQGTIYPALLRLEQRGWIRPEWGASDNNRRAKYYSLTRAGRKQLATETQDWERISAIIARMLNSA
jgi:PadR family transcriptional regulator, regulatory protein PadR